LEDLTWNEPPPNIVSGRVSAFRQRGGEKEQEKEEGRQRDSQMRSGQKLVVVILDMKTKAPSNG